MHGETAWMLDASDVPDFQIGTVAMWERRRTRELAGEAVRISNGVHRRRRAMRKIAFVDGWKYGREPRLERFGDHAVFH
jgi:hypothetical protein